MAGVKKSRRLQVFISHSSTDTWVASQIAQHIERCGAAYFLDEADIQAGDDFEDKIIAGARASEEMLLLLTPWAVQRPYILMEIGSFWTRRKRMVGVLHGLTVNSISTDPNVPVLLKRLNLLPLIDIDRYLAELTARVKAWEGPDGS